MSEEDGSMKKISSSTSLLGLSVQGNEEAEVQPTFTERISMEATHIREEFAHLKEKVVNYEHKAEEWIKDHIKLRGYANSSFGAAFNIMNATIGAGILSLPWVIKELGVIQGPLILFLAFCILQICFHLLHVSHQTVLEKQPDAQFYDDIGYAAYGTWMRWAIKLCLFFSQIGTLISFLQVIADFMSPIMIAITGNPKSVFAQRWTILLITYVPIMMFSMIKRMHDLRFISYISIGAVISFVGFLIVCFFANVTAPERKGELVFFRYNMNFPKTLGMIVFAYSCAASLIPINYEYEAKQHLLVSGSITMGGFSVFVIYLLCSLFGYLNFLDATQAPIVNSLVFNSNHWYNYIFTAIFCLMIFLTFPIAMIPCRLAFDNILSPIWRWKLPLGGPRVLKSANEKLDTILEWIWDHGENIRLFLETAFLCTICLLFAMLIPNVKLVMQVVGSSTTAATNLILPPLLYIKLTSYPWKNWKVILAIILLTFGVFFAIFVTLYNLITIFI